MPTCYFLMTYHVSVTVSRLPDDLAKNGYDVYVYSERGNKPLRDGDALPSGYTIGGETYWIDGATGIGFGGFVRGDGTKAEPTPGANYILFEGLTGNSFTLTCESDERDQINGIQIVPHLRTPGDVNVDGKVDETDAALLAANWGVGTETAAVSEPGVAVLTLDGLLRLSPSTSQHLSQPSWGKARLKRRWPEQDKETRGGFSENIGNLGVDKR